MHKEDIHPEMECREAGEFFQELKNDNTSRF